MKTIIVYYSMSGNTAWAAEQLAERLGADTLRLEPVKAYPDSGFKKFFWGGMHAVMAEKPLLEPYQFDRTAYERVILGFPVWASTFAPPLRSFVSEQREALRTKRVAAFACQSGSGAEKAFSKLCALLGVEQLEAGLVLIDPLTRPAPENGRRLDEFAEKLKN